MTGSADRPSAADVSVDVLSAPDPTLLRPAIAAVLAGRPWPRGPERTVAEAVARAAAGTLPRPRDTARGPVTRGAASSAQTGGG